MIILIYFVRHAAKPLEIEIVTHRGNSKFAAGERVLDDEASRIEIVLCSFSVGMESYFMKQWLKQRVGLAERVVKNYMEDWEAEAVATNQRVGKFKLANKYMGLILHDKEDGADAYDEVRRVCAIVWDRGSKTFKVNTELLRSADAADINEDVSSNQPYNINEKMHTTIKAAKLIPEGAEQTSVVLVDALQQQ